jgi:tetratricopeptide (TPR) repeat protein
MKKIILSTSLLLLLGTTTYAETKTPEVLKAEKAYNDRMTKSQNTADKASKQLQVDLDKYGLFSEKVADDYKAISEAYFSMGKFDESIEYALHAIKVEMKLLKSDDPKLAKLYFDTGNKYYMHKQHPTAILYMDKAVEIYLKSPQKESVALADTYEGIASIYINLEDFEKSLAYNEKALLLRKKLLPENDEAVQRSIQNSIFLKKELKKK